MNTTKREEVSLQTTPMELMLIMAENNPGAARVLSDMLKADPMAGLFDFLHLDDMNIRGTQIWVGFKDYCGEDLTKFVTLVRARDAKMVAHINREGVRGNHTAKAVQHGASKPGQRMLLTGEKE